MYVYNGRTCIGRWKYDFSTYSGDGDGDGVCIQNNGNTQMQIYLLSPSKSSSSSSSSFTSSLLRSSFFPSVAVLLNTILKWKCAFRCTDATELRPQWNFPFFFIFCNKRTFPDSFITAPTQARTHHNIMWRYNRLNAHKNTHSANLWRCKLSVRVCVCDMNAIVDVTKWTMCWTIKWICQDASAVRAVNGRMIIVVMKSISNVCLCHLWARSHHFIISRVSAKKHSRFTQSNYISSYESLFSMN